MNSQEPADSPATPTGPSAGGPAPPPLQNYTKVNNPMKHIISTLLIAIYSSASLAMPVLNENTSNSKYLTTNDVIIVAMELIRLVFVLI